MSIHVKNNIHWVGQRDWEVRDFHGTEYKTHKGTSYNSYLIREGKNVLIDTVDHIATQIPRLQSTLPVGVQLIGRRHHDRQVLRAGAALERATGFTVEGLTISYFRRKAGQAVALPPGAARGPAARISGAWRSRNAR